MINSIKKKLLNILKNIGYSLWSMAHGRIKGVIDPSKENFIEVIQSTFKENYCQPKGFMVWDLDWSAMYDPSWSSDVFNTYNPSSQPAYIGQPSRHSHLSAK